MTSTTKQMRSNGRRDLILFFTQWTNTNATLNEQWPVKYEMTTQKDSSLTVSICWNSSDNNHPTAVVMFNLSATLQLYGWGGNAKEYEVVRSRLKSHELCQVESSCLNLLKSTWGQLGVTLASSGVTFLDRSDLQV